MYLATVLLVVRIYGMAGSGKSTLVNRLCPDRNVVVSNQGEGTLISNKLENCTKYGWIVYDAPGYGTPTFPTIHNVSTRWEPLDFAIIVIGPRVYTQDVEAFEHFKQENITTLVVRSRCDVFSCDSFSLMKTTMVYFPGSIVFPQPDQEVFEGMINFIQQYNSIKV